MISLIMNDMKKKIRRKSLSIIEKKINTNKIESKSPKAINIYTVITFIVVF